MSYTKLDFFVKLNLHIGKSGKFYRISKTYCGIINVTFWHNLRYTSSDSFCCLKSSRSVFFFTNWASSSKSGTLKNDAAFTREKGSLGKRLVHWAGIEVSLPWSSWKNTRSPPQLWWYVIMVNSRPDSGWNGWVILKRLFLVTAVDDCVQ